MLKAFWGYYGAKWRAAPLYPLPVYDTIIEPFAGAAGYALHYHDRRVVLVDLDERIASVWDYLIRANESEILSIPIVDHLDELATWPQEVQWLVSLIFSDGFNFVSIRKAVSPARLAAGRSMWNEARRQRVADQLRFIRHWRVLHGHYTEAPDSSATWFIDPPYKEMGYRYKYASKDIDFAHLGAWCRSRRGQVIVCENTGADWLPFKHLANTRARAYQTSAEAVWENTPVEYFQRSGVLL